MRVIVQRLKCVVLLLASLWVFSAVFAIIGYTLSSLVPKKMIINNLYTSAGPDSWIDLISQWKYYRVTDRPAKVIPGLAGWPGWCL